MKSRWLSTFTVIGMILLVLGVVGLVLRHTGTGFVFDPGQPPASGQDHTALYYLIIGALMVLNGLVTPAPTPSEDAKSRPAAKNGAASSAPNPRPSVGREVIATTAEKPVE